MWVVKCFAVEKYMYLVCVALESNFNKCMCMLIKNMCVHLIYVIKNASISDDLNV